MASRRASLGVSPLQAAPNGNSATNGRKPAPIVTSLVPTYSGRWAPLPHAGLLRCLTSRQTPTVSHAGLRKSSTMYTLHSTDTVIPDTGFASLQGFLAQEKLMLTLLVCTAAAWSPQMPAGASPRPQAWTVPPRRPPGAAAPSLLPPPTLRAAGPRQGLPYSGLDGPKQIPHQHNATQSRMASCMWGLHACSSSIFTLHCSHLDTHPYISFTMAGCMGRWVR